jgi:HAD superfamily hydrolase (TIGR01509 family)
MSTLQAIVFDMDGTLADTEEIHRQAFNLAFVEWHCGWQWSREEYRRLLAVSGGRERIRQYLSQQRPELDAGQLSALAASMHRRKSDIYRELLAGTGIRLRPGVERLLREADAKGVRLAVATSSSRANLETLLRATLGGDSMGIFGAIVTSDVIEEKKPSPAVYERAIANLRVAPARSIAVEDTRNGNLAALAAGLRTIITTHSFTLDNDFSGAALVVDHLGEPDLQMHVLAGDPRGAQYVDIALLDDFVDGARAGTHRLASASFAK